jgi:hypothetical protein
LHELNRVPSGYRIGYNIASGLTSGTSGADIQDSFAAGVMADPDAYLAVIFWLYIRKKGLISLANIHRST